MITVHVRLFAGLHQLIGEREIEMILPDGATVAVLRDTLGAQHPVVEALLPTLVCAIDEEYVESDQVLGDGDRVALIPPVSGGERNGYADTRRKTTFPIRLWIALNAGVAVACLIASSLIYDGWLRMFVVVVVIWMLSTAATLLMWKFRREKLQQRGFRW